MARSLHRGAVAFLLAIVGCSEKGGEGAADASPVPASCKDVLVPRQTGAAACGSSPDRCAQAQSDSAREFQFVLTFSKPQDTKALTCLASFLTSSGATTTIGGGGITATGTFAAVSPAFELQMVANYAVSCPDCTDCLSLSADQCAQDAFCTDTTGMRFDATASCMGPREVIGCHAVPIAIIPEPAAYVDPQGSCWLVDCCGAPEGWTYASVGPCSELTSTPTCP